MIVKNWLSTTATTTTTTTKSVGDSAVSDKTYFNK